MESDNIVIIIFILFVVALVMISCKISVDNRAQCLAKGGEYHYGRAGDLCLKPDSVIKL